MNALCHKLRRIRRALAQSVSDYLPAERDKQKTHMQQFVFFGFSFHQKHIFFQKWTQEEPIPEQSSEIDSEMSSCCCFLLRQLFLVQKTAHVRGAVREPGPWS